MVIIATPSAQSIRLWRRRRRYQKLGSDTGPARSRSFRLGRLLRLKRRVSTLESKLSSPLKLLSKFHDAYVKMMTRMASSVGNNMYAIGAFSNGKKIHKPHNQVSVAFCGGEQVDVKLVLQIYNKIAASNNMAASF